MKCVKVLKTEAEGVKNKLMALNVLTKGYRPLVDKEFVYFPVNKEVKSFKIVDKKCDKIENKNVNIGAYDHIGDIIIVGSDVTKKDAKELLKINGVKVVLRKKGIHHGEFRTQDLEVVAGEKRKETLYKENGVSMKLNVEKCYFSPRLGTERMRIANLVKKGEKVLVLFSGVAPYPLVIARHSGASLIVGVEKNPSAHKYAMYNCRRYPNIKLVNKDVKDFKTKEKFDRILMPLPKSAEEFLLIAVKLLEKKGVIHFYDFEEEKDIPRASIEKIKNKIKKIEVLDVVKCGQYGPGKYRVCVDFKINY